MTIADTGHATTPAVPRDAVLEELRQLRLLAPDHDRGERVRARCRGRLTARNRRAVHQEITTDLGRRALARAVMLGLGALYVASLVGAALQFLNPVLHNGQIR